MGCMRALFFFVMVAQDRHEDVRRAHVRRAHVRRRLELALYAVISMGMFQRRRIKSIPSASRLSFRTAARISMTNVPYVQPSHPLL